ncbi:hypothetical protein Bbelb_430360 [Branchiostoma belcheri]|nr:hypothetical protein Bbelb_430360 [Branchiostoma belcheri]
MGKEMGEDSCKPLANQWLLAGLSLPIPTTKGQPQEVRSQKLAATSRNCLHDQNLALVQRKKSYVLSMDPNYVPVMETLPQSQDRDISPRRHSSDSQTPPRQGKPQLPGGWHSSQAHYCTVS